MEEHLEELCAKGATSEEIEEQRKRQQKIEEGIDITLKLYSEDQPDATDVVFVTSRLVKPVTLFRLGDVSRFGDSSQDGEEMNEYLDDQLLFCEWWNLLEEETQKMIAQSGAVLFVIGLSILADYCAEHVHNFEMTRLENSLPDFLPMMEVVLEFLKDTDPEEGSNKKFMLKMTEAFVDIAPQFRSHYEDLLALENPSREDIIGIILKVRDQMLEDTPEDGSSYKDFLHKVCKVVSKDNIERLCDTQNLTQLVQEAKSLREENPELFSSLPPKAREMMDRGIHWAENTDISQIRDSVSQMSIPQNPEEFYAAVSPMLRRAGLDEEQIEEICTNPQEAMAFIQEMMMRQVEDSSGASSSSGH